MSKEKTKRGNTGYVILAWAGTMEFGYVYFYRNPYGVYIDTYELSKAHIFREKIVAEYIACRMNDTSSFIYDVIKIKKVGKNIEICEEKQK